jgi:hypothetical protein
MSDAIVRTYACAFSGAPRLYPNKLGAFFALQPYRGSLDAARRRINI